MKPKTVNLTVAHYARRRGRVITFRTTAERSEFFAHPPATQERLHELHHAFVFVASCPREFDGLYAICYGRRGWSLKTITSLFRRWTAAHEDWRALLDPRRSPRS